MTKKFGFTLSEILITLAIIGIVAAMTVPTIISKYSTSEYSARTKKAYGLVSGVFEEAWRNSGVDNVSKLTEAHLRKAVEDTLRTRAGSFSNTQNLSGNGSATPATTYTYTVPDGSTFGFSRNGNAYTVIIDCNGKKGPNQWGRDVYRFTVSGGDPTLRPDATNDCSATGHNVGYGCSKALMQNGWEIDW